MVLDLITLADEALLVLLTHVRVELVVAKEALATELAEGMDAAFDLLCLLAVVASVASGHGREVDGEDIGIVEGVLVGEDLFEAYA